MKDSYRISMQTPIGTQSGVLSFAEKDGVLSGSIRTMGNTHIFENGKIEEHSFEFSGIFNAGFLHFKYAARGIVNGDKLQAAVRTNYGVFQMFGTRIVESDGR